MVTTSDGDSRNMELSEVFWRRLMQALLDDESSLVINTLGDVVVVMWSYFRFGRLVMHAVVLSTDCSLWCFFTAKLIE
jgi:hypothetical protein